MDSARTFTGHTIEDTDRGTKIVRGVEVFRAGTFRDSMGEQRTWEKKDLRKMVSNFHKLRDADLFTEVPMRRDHSWSVDKVMGYITDAYVKGDKLVVDYEIVDAEQVDKLISGKYRKVSSEIGMYSDNDDNSYWPVLMGVAYVDIPAVEHLHGKQINKAHFYEYTQEGNVDPKNDDRGASRPSSFRINGTDTTDHAAVQAYITELEARPGPATFRVNGTEVADAVEVQKHIDVLEGFRQGALETGRSSFVKELESSGRIVATQTEALTELALEMTDEQFEKFKKSYEAAPKLAILANHGQSAKGGSATDPANEAEDEVAVLEGQIRQFRHVQMTDEQIKNTKAYKRLAEIRQKS